LANFEAKMRVLPFDVRVGNITFIDDQENFQKIANSSFFEEFSFLAHRIQPCETTP